MAPKNAKIVELEGCATTLWGLGTFAGDSKEGVHPDKRGEIENQRSLR